MEIKIRSSTDSVPLHKENGFNILGQWYALFLVHANRDFISSDEQPFNHLLFGIGDKIQKNKLKLFQSAPIGGRLVCEGDNVVEFLNIIKDSCLRVIERGQYHDKPLHFKRSRINN